MRLHASHHFSVVPPREQLRTQAVTDTNESQRALLAGTIGTTHASDLRAHLVRQAVFVLAKDLDLLETGLAIANDETEKVSLWITEGKLARPSEEQHNRWLSSEQLRFRTMVVQPYVLVHLLGDSESADLSEQR